MVFLTLFLATTSSACRRLLADAVSALDVDAPRLLEQREMHFTAGQWGANGVLHLEANGVPCASGTHGDAGDGDFSASWDTPTQGCYRVDAHSAGEECGFGGQVTVTVDWCAGRTDTIQYTQNGGWTALGIYPFYPGHLSGITQAEGAVDAFRVVAQPNCHPQHQPTFGSLTVDTDADAMPEDLASQLAQQLVDMGDVLTASFRQASSRRLSGSNMNHVVIDMDTSRVSHMPTDDQISEAAQKVCGLLLTTACATDVSFKLDESGEVTRIQKKKERRVRGAKDVVMMMPMFGFVTVCVLAVLAKKFVTLKPASNETPTPQGQTKGAQEEGKPVAEGKAVDWGFPEEEIFWDADEEKKPGEQEDDNVSTATPVSLPDSLPSLALDQNLDRV
jgi:hypothetical protein